MEKTLDSREKAINIKEKNANALVTQVEKKINEFAERREWAMHNSLKDILEQYKNVEKVNSQRATEQQQVKPKRRNEPSR